MSLPPDDDTLGFAVDLAAVGRRRSVATDLVGQRIAAVTYLMLESGRHETGVPNGGIRPITEVSDWEDPSWQADGFHQIEFAIEFTTEAGAVFHVAWDPPGWIEGLRFAAGRAQVREAAAWDVSGVEPWGEFRRAPISRVDLHYRPWNDEGGWWCTAMTLVAGDGRVEISLNDADAHGSLMVSADNLAVLWGAIDGRERERRRQELAALWQALLSGGVTSHEAQATIEPLLADYGDDELLHQGLLGVNDTVQLINGKRPLEPVRDAFARWTAERVAYDADPVAWNRAWALAYAARTLPHLRPQARERFVGMFRDRITDDDAAELLAPYGD